MTGGTSPAASWVATILRSISTRRTACSRASLHSADDLVLSATATHLSLAVVPPA